MTRIGDSTGPPWRILVVDDEQRSAQNNATALTQAAGSRRLPYSVEAVAEESFEEALARVGLGGIDLLVLDVFDQAGAGAGPGTHAPQPLGRSVFEQVRAKRFLPIIFLTALPRHVESHKNAPFVQVVSKTEESTDPFAPLVAAVKRCLDSPFPSLHRAMQSHIDGVSREFMIDFVEQHWEDLKGRAEDVAHLLMRRLGVSFDTGQHVLVYGPTKASSSASNVPPIRYYVVPAPSEHRMGDIITPFGAVDPGANDTTRWYMVMTPSCDLVEGRTKAESVVLAECVPLESFDEYRGWVDAETGSKSKREKIERLLKSNPHDGSKNRYFYLPAAWKLPDLMVDLQRITHVPHSELSQYHKQASLDSPYAAALSHQFYCYLGRVGTPDLDLKAVINGMRPSSSA